MSRTPAFLPGKGAPPLPKGPSADEWARMSAREQEQFEYDVIEALESRRDFMAEGTPHQRPKVRAQVDLGDFFRRADRRVFLASEFGVLYPGEDAFAPDLLAVVDTDPEREMNTWVVAREGRGIDFIMEFRNLGSKHKDLVENVATFARLRVPEYFSLDVNTKSLRGFRLPPGGGTYVPIVPQGGRLLSTVLGLELAIVDGRLRFFQDLTPVLDSSELVTLLERMVGERDRRVDEVEQARAEAERQRAEAEQARVSQVAARVLAVLAARGVTVSEDERTRILAVVDFDQALAMLERVVAGQPSLPS